jgi:hypothetical protein
MGKNSKSRKTALALNAARYNPTIGKNPHVVDMKFESGIHKLDYHILPIIFIPYNQMHHHLHKLAAPLVLLEGSRPKNPTALLLPLHPPLAGR